MTTSDAEELSLLVCVGPLGLSSSLSSVCSQCIWWGVLRFNSNVLLFL